MKNLPGAGGKELSPSKKPYWILFALAICFFVVPVLGDDLGQQKSQDEAAIEARLKQTVEYLASDELQGRGPRTEGIDRAADYIAKRMGKMGLQTDLFQGSPYQDFSARVMNYEDDSRFSWQSMFGYIGRTLYDAYAENEDSQGKKKSTAVAVKVAEGPVNLKNVVAVLAAQGPLAEETLVIGAHYDHLGERKSSNGEKVVYHGANDNASGVAVMLETAEILAAREKKLPRRVVFAAFSGEESGLLGSLHYVNHPPVPLEKTIAMINLDVVGRMQGDIVVTMGTSTSPMFAKVLPQIVKQRQLNLVELPGVMAGSDHVSFYVHHIPVVFFLTQGGTSDYHRPSDVASSLNYTGMRKIAQIAADLAVALAEAEQRPELSEEGANSILFRNLVRLWGSVSDN